MQEKIFSKILELQNKYGVGLWKDLNDETIIKTPHLYQIIDQLKKGEGISDNTQMNLIRIFAAIEKVPVTPEYYLSYS